MTGSTGRRSRPYPSCLASVSSSGSGRTFAFCIFSTLLACMLCWLRRICRQCWRPKVRPTNYNRKRKSLASLRLPWRDNSSAVSVISRTRKSSLLLKKRCVSDSSFCACSSLRLPAFSLSVLERHANALRWHWFVALGQSQNDAGDGGAQEGSRRKHWCVTEPR